MNWRLSAFFVEKHRLFGAKTTINLGGYYFYRFEVLGDDSLSISRKINESFIDDFFGGEISMVSAIVGANGVGKTSIIMEVLINPDTILIFEDGEKSFVVKNQYRFTKDKAWYGIYLEDKTAKEVVIPRSAINSKHLDKPTVDFNLKGAPNILYYNPLAHVNPFISDYNIARFQFGGVYELAQNILLTNLKLISDFELMKEIKKVYPRFPNIAKASIGTKGLVLEDLLDVELTLSGSYDGSGVDTRQALIDRFEKQVSTGKYQEKIYFLSRRISSEILESSLNAAIKLYAMSRLLVHVDEIRNSFSIDFEPYAKEDEKINFEVNDIIRWLEELNTLLPISKSKLKLRSKYFISQAIEWIKDYPKEEKLNIKQLEFLIESNFFLRQDELERLFVNSNATDLTGKIDFNLAIVSPSYSLSQGEEILLNLLSSFHNSNEFSENRSQILFLDEATVGYHPRWQKKFVKAITELIPVIFKNNLSSVEGSESKPFPPIQIIFSTHDPFSLSDLPRYNIAYLDTFEGLTKVIDNEDSEKQKKAFGANITDLLEDSFFIGEEDNALVGEFAQNKINEVIKWIELEKIKKEKLKKDYILNDDEFERKLSLIKLIDEHIIQLKLAEMLDELKTTNDVQKTIIKAQISGLEDKLNNLDT
ncbi:MAG: ATP-binding protein [Flavobacteriaceae bacterium]|nr:ATP-binding protein [Flavobacteriaceae bacterium]